MTHMFLIHVSQTAIPARPPVRTCLLGAVKANHWLLVPDEREIKTRSAELRNPSFRPAGQQIIIPGHQNDRKLSNRAVARDQN